MKALLIGLAILGGIILFLVFLLFTGSAKVRIISREKVKVIASVLGIRFTLYPKKDDTPREPRDLARCRNPERVLRKELRRQRKAAAKALKKKRKAEEKAARKKKAKEQKKKSLSPAPNLLDNLEMILALLKKLYGETQGKFKLRVRRMHLRIGSDNAADTAVLYGVVVQAAAGLLQWLQTHFIPIRRRPGEMTIEPDFNSTQCHADIDIICSIRLYRALGIALHMLSAYRKEKRIAKQKAKMRFKANKKRRGKASDTHSDYKKDMHIRKEE